MSFISPRIQVYQLPVIIIPPKKTNANKYKTANT